MSMPTLEFSEIVRLPTEQGLFQAFAVREGELEHFVVFSGETQNRDILVRIHSSCLTGDVFTSLRCDCYHQLRDALEMIARTGGAVVYLMQEGRGIGLFNKIRAYACQEQGMNTLDANTHLGLPVDDRNYTVAARILRHLAPRSVTLLTNNPEKVAALKAALPCDLHVQPLPPRNNPHNHDYLTCKHDRLNHRWDDNK